LSTLNACMCQIRETLKTLLMGPGPPSPTRTRVHLKVLMFAMQKWCLCVRHYFVISITFTSVIEINYVNKVTEN